MATKYVDGTNGDNANDGSSWALAKKTVLGARAVTLANDLVVIAPGVYKEANQAWNSANDVNVLYMADPTKSGAVIIDFDFTLATITTGTEFVNWGIYQGTRFLNLSFRNPYRATNMGMIGTANPGGVSFYHCVFYTVDGPGALGNCTEQLQHNALLRLINCSVYNLRRVSRASNLQAFNSYYAACTTYMVSPLGTTRDYNAYPGNTEVNGINTTTGANPGFRDTAEQDFRLDPVTTPADYATFMGAGQFGDRIGANGRGGLHYRADVSHLRFFTPVPLPAAGNPQPIWENEGPNGTNTYTDGTPGDIIENSSTKELEIDLVTTPTATGGRIRSEVMDLGSVSPNLDELALGASESLPDGAAIDTDTTLPQLIEYRASSTAFAKGDASPSWVTASRFGAYVNQGHRYFQERITLRTDHTNV